MFCCLDCRFAGLDARFFIGYLQGEELAAAYASADAFVYASETETMGNVVLEAMAAGAAVVVRRPAASQICCTTVSLASCTSHGTRQTPCSTRGLCWIIRNCGAPLGNRAAAVEKGNWKALGSRVRQVYRGSDPRARRSARSRTPGDSGSRRWRLMR